MHLTPVEVHVSCMSPVVNSTHIPSDSSERTAMAPSWSFPFMHRRYHSTVMVQVVSVILLYPLYLGVYSGSGTTEEAIRLELLLCRLTLLPDRWVQARTEYTLFRPTPYAH